ncbi:hypothetical protein L1987_74312 [Smallanthus sonchifolius]|uniref:Uncharacterized protein n=1 Tax=Smallanthus sonchifolius TaxID=185202 RepID=A0ACB9A1L9_9ASTR|nr:hypothetical protein L1987_74312 [Smallanthus sonchifolius]
MIMHYVPILLETMDFYSTNPGPIDDSVLYDQEKHVSSAIWEGQERGALRCHEHTSKLDQWTLTSKQIELAGRYSWGAATLSFLYRALGNASLRSQSTISGCLTLLQCWSYFRLNIGRPRLNHDPIHDRFPFVFRWKGKHTGPTANRDVAFYRKALDSLKPSEVEWCPYINISDALLPEDIRDNLILGRSNTMLICFDKAERHLPDRCLRQFGMRQPIPLDVQQWERKSRGVDGGVDLSGKMETELSEWSDRHLRVVDVDEDVEESQYLHWFLKITRKLVGRPVPISSEFQRMNAALRDIANIADMMSTHGMDDQQMHAVTRIRYLAHECLRDQIGSMMIAEVTDSDQNEFDKKVRGKERIRRKGMGVKRRRKDDSRHFESVSSQQQFCVAASIDMMDPAAPMCHVENNDIEICPDQLCYMPSKLDESQRLSDAANELDDSSFCRTVEEIDHDLLSGGAVADHPLENGDIAQQNDYSVLV